MIDDFDAAIARIHRREIKKALFEAMVKGVIFALIIGLAMWAAQR